MFSLVITTIFFLTHYYIYRKICEYINIKRKWIAIVTIVLLSLSNIIIRIINNYIQSDIIQSIKIFLFLWIGFILYLFVFMLIADIISELVKFGVRLNLIKIKVNIGRILMIFALGMSVLITGYGIIEARNIQIKRFAINTKKSLKAAYRIVQLTDLHIGSTGNGENLKRIVDLVNNEKPDIVVITGDMIDANSARLKYIVPILKGIDSRLGIYAVLGNHEFYAGVEGAIDIMRQAGIKVLLDDSVIIDKSIRIIGLIDESGERYGYNNTDISSIFQGDKNIFTILLEHRPIIYNNRIDLQLSGHTHNGQFFPGIIIVKILFNYTYGMYNINGFNLYVSSGAGTAGPPIRLLAPPEIAVFDIKHY